MKTILITGGGDGLGNALARSLSLKHNVIITSRSKEKIDKNINEIKCDGVVMDVTNFHSVESGIQYIINKYKKIDCLINNAGLWIEGELESNSNENITKVIDTNLLGVILVSKSVIPFMKKQGQGTILNINSQNGLHANKERSVYTASKWGLTGFTKSLQSELSKSNIFVTGIYPGKMNTDLFSKAGVIKKMDDAIDVGNIVDIVDFILSRPKNVLITEIGVKSILH
jgi:NADP-dependent 3-hydroxy acid dehydrogenase YdfG